MTLIIVFLLCAIVGFVVYNANQLKSIHLTNSIEIEASSSTVFEMVGNQNNFHKWSPFLHNDPMLKYEIKVAEGVGAQLLWSGGKDGKDQGSQTVVKAVNTTQIGIRCDIEKPFPSQSTFDYAFTQSGNTTIVQQEFKMESSLGSAVFLWIFGVKKQIDANNKLGLQLLKKASETNR